MAKNRRIVVHRFQSRAIIDQFSKDNRWLLMNHVDVTRWWWVEEEQKKDGQSCPDYIGRSNEKYPRARHPHPFVVSVQLIRPVISLRLAHSDPPGLMQFGGCTHCPPFSPAAILVVDQWLDFVPKPTREKKSQERKNYPTNTGAPCAPILNSMDRGIIKQLPRSDNSA